MTIEQNITDINSLPPEVVVGANLLAEGLDSLDDSSRSEEAAVEHTNIALEERGLDYEFVKKPKEEDFARLFDRLTDEHVLPLSTPIDSRRKLFERMVRIDTDMGLALNDERPLNDKPTEHFVRILRGMAHSKRRTR
jgi:hypothetical protein